MQFNKKSIAIRCCIKGALNVLQYQIQYLTNNRPNIPMALAIRKEYWRWHSNTRRTVLKTLPK